MKTKIYSIVICFLSIYSFLFTSCDEGDTTKPVIELIEPEEGAELLIGSENGVHFEMDLSDNEQLASYKVEIHNNFGENYHGHGTAFAPAMKRFRLLSKKHGMYPEEIRMFITMK